MMRLVTFFLCAIIAMGALAFWTVKAVPGMADGPHVQVIAARPGGAMIEQRADSDSPTVINRDDSGQFHLTARLNGHDMPFLIDTGADFIALTIADAQEIGLPVDTSAFQPISRTASGVTNGAMYDLDELEVAGKSFRNVQVVVLEGLQTNLLGQPVLSRLGKVSLQGDRMVIERE